MQPAAIIFIESWPLTLNGKIDKKLLPAADLNLMQGEYIPASNETEQFLVELWAELLKLPADDISVTANFFDLGGHSLLAVSLIAKINDGFSQSLTIKEVFELQSIKECALHLDYLQARAANKIITRNEVGDAEAPALEEMEW